MVDYCNRCGIPSDEVRLFDAISNFEIVSLCKKCLDFEGLPVISRPTTSQLKDLEKNEGSSSFKKNVSKVFDMKKFKKNPEDVTLKDLVEKNYVKKVKFEKKPRPELVDNFHWIIMIARRKRKLSQVFVAKEIGESELAIKMAEKGILPEDDYKLIGKLESYFGVELIKKSFKEKIGSKKELELDKVSLSSITISDLKKLKEEQNENSDFEEEDFEENQIDENDGEEVDYFEEEFDEENFESKHTIKENKDAFDFSQRDIDNLLFRS